MSQESARPIRDMRREPLTQRKALLERSLTRAGPGLCFNEHLDEEDGLLVFHHACKLGLEGVVSKRRDAPYSGDTTPLAGICSRVHYVNGLQEELEGQQAA